MSKQPEKEDIIQFLMSTMRCSREEAEQGFEDIEKLFSKDLFTPRPSRAKSKKTSKPSYTQTNYPHYRPSISVLKYTLRITLRGIKPAIWRKIEVPSNITLRHLGDLILDLMGWENYHLNQYHKGNDFYLPFYQRDMEAEEDMFFDNYNYNQEDYTIADILSKKGATHLFEYDFGDSWEHEIRLSSIDEYTDKEPHEIVFVGGKRACPPEDCGGVWGYEELLAILEKRKAHKRLTSDEKGYLEWAGWDDDFDPDYLDKDLCMGIVRRFNK